MYLVTKLKPLFLFRKANDVMQLNSGNANREKINKLPTKFLLGGAHHSLEITYTLNNRYLSN